MGQVAGAVHKSAGIEFAFNVYSRINISIRTEFAVKRGYRGAGRMWCDLYAVCVAICCGFHDEVTADLTVVLPCPLPCPLLSVMIAAIHGRDNQDATFKWTANGISGLFGLVFLCPCFVL